LNKIALIKLFTLIILFNISGILTHKLSKWEFDTASEYYVLQLVSIFLIFLCGLVIEFKKREKENIIINKKLLVFTACIIILSFSPPNVLNYIVEVHLKNQTLIKVFIAPIIEFRNVTAFLSGVLFVRSFSK
jgi:uncharacterized membrane protein YbjE (DUF340 family)